MAILYPTKDSYLAQASSELGTGVTMACGQIVVLGTPVLNRILISFDLTAYAGVSIYAATLRLILTQAEFPDGPHTVSVHELTKDWTEGQESWTEAADGDNWATPGGDYEATAFSTASIANGATILDLNLLPLVLQKRGGAMNCLIKLPEGSGHNNHFFTCHSREAVSEANRPTLTLAALACISVGDEAITGLAVNDEGITTLTINDVGCVA